MGKYRKKERKLVHGYIRNEEIIISIDLVNMILDFFCLSVREFAGIWKRREMINRSSGCYKQSLNDFRVAGNFELNIHENGSFIFNCMECEWEDYNESFSGHIHIVSIEKCKLIFDKIRGIEKRYAFYTAMQAKSEYHRISNELSGQYQRRITEYIKRIEDIWKLHDKQRYEQHQKEIEQFIKKREKKVKNDNAMDREI